MGCLPCFKGWKFSLLVSQSILAGFPTFTDRPLTPIRVPGLVRAMPETLSLGCLSSLLRCPTCRTASPPRCGSVPKWHGIHSVADNRLDFSIHLLVGAIAYVEYGVSACSFALYRGVIYCKFFLAIGSVWADDMMNSVVAPRFTSVKSFDCHSVRTQRSLRPLRWQRKRLQCQAAQKGEKGEGGGINWDAEWKKAKARESLPSTRLL